MNAKLTPNFFAYIICETPELRQDVITCCELHDIDLNGELHPCEYAADVLIHGAGNTYQVCKGQSYVSFAVSAKDFLNENFYNIN